MRKTYREDGSIVFDSGTRKIVSHWTERAAVPEFKAPLPGVIQTLVDTDPAKTPGFLERNRKKIYGYGLGAVALGTLGVALRHSDDQERERCEPYVTATDNANATTEATLLTEVPTAHVVVIQQNQTEKSVDASVSRAENHC